MFPWWEGEGWINRKGHELWFLSGLEREKPFNFLGNLKPFTWKNYLNKGNRLHLLSRGIIVWTELKPYIYIILWHSAEEVETTPNSLYCLSFMLPLPVGGNTAMPTRSLSCSFLPNSSWHSWEAKCHKPVSWKFYARRRQILSPLDYRWGSQGWE